MSNNANLPRGSAVGAGAAVSEPYRVRYDSAVREPGVKPLETRKGSGCNGFGASPCRAWLRGPHGTQVTIADFSTAAYSSSLASKSRHDQLVEIDQHETEQCHHKAHRLYQPQRQHAEQIQRPTSTFLGIRDGQRRQFRQRWEQDRRHGGGGWEWWQACCEW